MKLFDQHICISTMNCRYRAMFVSFPPRVATRPTTCRPPERIR